MREFAILAISHDIREKSWPTENISLSISYESSNGTTFLPVCSIFLLEKVHDQRDIRERTMKKIFPCVIFGLVTAYPSTRKSLKKSEKKMKKWLR